MGCQNQITICDHRKETKRISLMIPQEKDDAQLTRLTATFAFGDLARLPQLSKNVTAEKAIIAKRELYEGLCIVFQLAR
jgi:hypothetical protein